MLAYHVRIVSPAADEQPHDCEQCNTYIIYPIILVVITNKLAVDGETVLLSSAVKRHAERVWPWRQRIENQGGRGSADQGDAVEARADRQRSRPLLLLYEANTSGARVPPVRGYAYWALASAPSMRAPRARPHDRV